MIDTDKICRVMAEEIWDAIPAYDDPLYKEEEIKDFEKAFLNHTILPEMVELFKLQTAFMANVMHTIVSQNYDQYLPEVKALFEANKGLGAKCVNVLAKAEGRK